VFDGSVELDESYLGGTRKDKKGRGAADKVVVFSILRRNDKVHTAVVEGAKTATSVPIIVKKIKPDSIVYTDSWKAYNALDVNQFRYKRINHPVYFAEGKNHINMDRQEIFSIILKECEFGFNYGTPKEHLKHCRLGMDFKLLIYVSPFSDLCFAQVLELFFPPDSDTLVDE